MTSEHIPFKDIPQLRGPLPDGDFVRPANGMTSMFFRWLDTDAQWYWTPDEEKSFWMPCSTIIVSQGKWKGKKPAYFNVEIIQYLNETRQEPPTDMKPATLEELKKEIEENPFKSTPSEAAKMNAQLGTSNVQETKVIRSKSNENIVLSKDDISTKQTLIIKDCHNCTLNLAADAYCVKVHIDDSNDCSFEFNGKIISQVTEMYKCKNIKIKANNAIKTLQVESCDGVDVEFEKKDHFHSVVWAGTKKMNVAILEDEKLKKECDVDVIRQKNPSKEIRDDIDQFITRIVDEKLLTERIIRLPNGFPTTEREKEAFEAKQQRNFDAFAKNAGITFTRTAHVGEKTQKRNEPCNCGSGKKYKVCCGAVQKKENL